MNIFILFFYENIYLSVRKSSETDLKKSKKNNLRLCGWFTIGFLAPKWRHMPTKNIVKNTFAPRPKYITYTFLCVSLCVDTTKLRARLTLDSLCGAPHRYFEFLSFRYSAFPLAWPNNKRQQKSRNDDDDDNEKKCAPSQMSSVKNALSALQRRIVVK